MHWSSDIHEELHRFYAGSNKSLSRLLTIVENNPTLRPLIYKALLQSPKESYTPILGVTGPPGVGKSTFINQLLTFMKSHFSSIGVIVIDPSSEESGGALLGDRVRMVEHATDDRIFIRSVATREKSGGICAVLYDFIHIFQNFTFDLIIIETAGIGQSEIAISRLSDQTILLLEPDAGDSIQILKAGILEICDTIIINKIDRGFSPMKANIHANLTRQKSIFETSATSGDGIEQIVAHIIESIKHVDRNRLTRTRIVEHAKSIALESCQESVRQFIKEQMDNRALRNPYLLANKISIQIQR